MLTYQEIKDKILLEDADDICSRGMKVTQCAGLDSIEDMDGDELVYVLKREYQDCFCMSAREAYFLLKVGEETQKLYTYYQIMQLCDKKVA